jgi:hypothetical protein
LGLTLVGHKREVLGWSVQIDRRDSFLLFYFLLGRSNFFACMVCLLHVDYSFFSPSFKLAWPLNGSTIRAIFAIGSARTPFSITLVPVLRWPAYLNPEQCCQHSPVLSRLSNKGASLEVNTAVALPASQPLHHQHHSFVWPVGKPHSAPKFPSIFSRDIQSRGSRQQK